MYPGFLTSSDTNLAVKLQNIGQRLEISDSGNRGIRVSML